MPFLAYQAISKLNSYACMKSHLVVMKSGEERINYQLLGRLSSEDGPVSR